MVRIWTLVGLLLTAVAGASAATNPPERPNVVFILADDLGIMDIGAYNPRTFYETPNIDRLAAGGMRFTAGYAACPVCSPTRASIMTGKYPPRTGITDFIGGTRSGRFRPAPNQDHLALEEVTIAEALKAAGYATFFAGKWHLGDGKYSPNAQGFGPGLLGKNQFYYPPSPVPPPSPKDDPKTTDRIADEAVRFIEANKDRPFFAYLPFLAVHIPIGARSDIVAKYEHKKETAPPDAWGREHDNQVRLVQNNAVYAAMLEQLDAGVGRVLKALEQNGVADRTIVVFMSDNGGLSTAEGHPTSNLPWRAGKGWVYEGGIREPWIIRAGGHKTGQPVRHGRHQHRLLPDLARSGRAAARSQAALRRAEPDGVAQGGQIGPRPAVLALSALQQPGQPARRARCATATGSSSNGTRMETVSSIT